MLRRGVHFFNFLGFFYILLDFLSQLENVLHLRALRDIARFPHFTVGFKKCLGEWLYVGTLNNRPTRA